jgi:hypothetical protein
MLRREASSKIQIKLVISKRQIAFKRKMYALLKTDPKKRGERGIENLPRQILYL